MSSLSPKVIQNNLASFEPSLEEKILLEKRKRSQVYITLDYILSFITYFDFFSLDAFKIAIRSKYFAQSCDKKIVGSEFLLIPFFESNSQISKILQESNLSKTSIRNMLSSNFTSKKLSLGEKIWVYTGIPLFIDKVTFDGSIKYSYEAHLIFEKAAENALLRFKTPVITPEILFITIMEQKNSKAERILKKFLTNQMDWYLLRYKLLKRIHNQEVNIRSEVKKNQQYFAYIFKTQISEIEFDRLIESDIVSLGILLFRNKLITKILSIELFDCLDNETHKSIKTTNNRKYSS